MAIRAFDFLFEKRQPLALQNVTEIPVHPLNRQYWATLCPDLVIKQTLMRSMKRSGGLTRSRSMTELSQIIWIFSMPILVHVNERKQNLTGFEEPSHAEAVSSRIASDLEEVKR